MHIFASLLLLIIITSCNNSGGGLRLPETQEIKVNNEFHSFLKEGVYEVEYYASKKITTEHKHLLQKLSKLIETNTQAQKYFRQMQDAGKPAYNSNIGITRHEYKLLLDLLADKAPEKLRGTLKILRDGDRIGFKGEERLSLLDSLFININNKNASFKKYTLSQVQDSMDLSREDIPKGDRLEAYEFYRGPGGLLGLTGLDGVYELLIGRLRPGGKTYLSFSTRQPYNIEHPFPEYVQVILD